MKPAAATAGCETVFWRVNVKPGKPLFYATARGGKQLFGLPGNPVSALVCYALFVLPALHRRLGIREDDAGLPRYEARLTDALKNGSNRPHYVRGTLRGGEFVPRGLQESHGLAGLAEANALVRVPEKSVIEAEQVVEARLLGALAGGC